MKKIDYYRRLVEIYRSYKKKETVLSHLPVRLWIEPTNHCNLRCIMCPNRDLDKSSKGYMDFDLFRKIVDEAAGFVFDVHLLHRGESLLHPDFFRMASYARDAGIITRFHTNGTLLDEDKSRRLLDSGIEQFTFSFDGFNKETYERIRVNADFEKTVDNIVRFLNIKKSLGAKKPTTVIELIDFPDPDKKPDPSLRKAFAARFRGLPLDKITVKEIHNWAGDAGEAVKKSRYSPCTFLWHALIIFWDGSVLPCTQDFFGHTALGNVRHAPLAQIWNNEKMVELRRRIIQGDISDLATCSGCDRLWRKQFLGVPKEYLLRFLLKKMM